MILPRLLKILTRLYDVLLTEATSHLMRLLATESKELLIELMVLVLWLSKHFLTLGALDVGAFLAVMEAMRFEFGHLDQFMTILAVGSHLALVLDMVLDYCWLFKKIVLHVTVVAGVHYYIFTV